jgi:outer membrane protein TolC
VRKRSYLGRTSLTGTLLVIAAARGVPLFAQLGAPATPKAASSPPPAANGPVSSMGGNYQGSVATGQATAAPIDLSLSDAIGRGLKTNLGILTTSESVSNVSAQRKRVLSGLLPNLTGDYTQSYNRVNLAAEGFHFSAPPGIGFSIPTIVTFGSVDTRANLAQSVVNFQKLRNLKSADVSVHAAQLSVQDSRDLVVEAVGNAYLLIISDMARVDAAQAQVDTSQVLFNRAVDQHAAGVAPAIDQLRAEVQLRTDQQTLLASKNQYEKDKLVLGRVIGLPPGQLFNTTDRLPVSPLNGITTEDALRQAYANRADFKAAEEQVRAAEIARSASVAAYYPTVDLSGNFGDAGVNVGISHNVWNVTGALNFTIFDGGRIRSDIEEADSTLRQRKNDLGDLRGQIDQQVRTALLDLQSAADQVAVAQRNQVLAHETLDQSRDRFTAGVTDNLEVVQAQQSVVTADVNLISATYQHNLAKIELARALGMAEQNIARFTVH